jgi:hypothetical protein
MHWAIIPGFWPAKFDWAVLAGKVPDAAGATAIPSPVGDHRGRKTLKPASLLASLLARNEQAVLTGAGPSSGGKKSFYRIKIF